jgi:hypothetical protein
MTYITTTISWHKLTDKLPEDLAYSKTCSNFLITYPLLISLDGTVRQAMFHKGNFYGEREGKILQINPEKITYWAYWPIAPDFKVEK